MQQERPAPPRPLELTLYSKRDCPLCDELRAALAGWDAGRGAYRLTVVDIESDPALERRHGLRIPVLAHGETEICAGRFDPLPLEALVAGV